MGNVYIEFGVAQILVVGERAVNEVHEGRVGEYLAPREIAEGGGILLGLESLGILLHDAAVDVIDIIFLINPAACERRHAQSDCDDK